MRKYDGIKYSYKHSDHDSVKNYERVKNILGFLPPLNGLSFDLSFYSGGIGILDKLAISCKVNREQWDIVRKKLTLHSPETALLMDCWAEEFVWLIDAEGEEGNINQFASEFINSNKREFQEPCSPTSEIYFSYQSGVNNWTAVWCRGLTLNYLYFDQG
jgi:hypothetical protein